MQAMPQEAHNAKESTANGITAMEAMLQEAKPQEAPNAKESTANDSTANGCNATWSTIV